MFAHFLHKRVIVELIMFTRVAATTAIWFLQCMSWILSPVVSPLYIQSSDAPQDLTLEHFNETPRSQCVSSEY